jgi:hypothetical protein
MDTIEEILYQLDEGDKEKEKENEKENEKQLLLPLEETPTSAEMDPTSLTLEIIEKFRLIRFELDAIRIIPHRSASIDITIFGDNGKQYCRTLFLCGQAYLDYVLSFDFSKALEEHREKVQGAVKGRIAIIE